MKDRIQNIMRYGRSDIDDEYLAIIKAEIEDFVEKVYNSIREFGYNLKNYTDCICRWRGSGNEEFQQSRSKEYLLYP